MKEKGSITVFFSVLLPLFLIILLILTDVAQYHFHLQRVRTENYLYLDDQLSGYHRELFNEMGLLVLEDSQGLAPLSEREVLEESILLLMKEAQLRDGIYWAEDLLGELIQHKMGLDLELFDLSDLNRELSDIIEKAKKGEISEELGLNFFTKVVAMQPYVKLKGISLEQLKKYVLEMDKEALEKINPIFVLDDGVREKYEEFYEALSRYDVLNLLGSYALADYAVEYLGYSMTKKEIEGLRCEYLLTGLEDQGSQRTLIKAELYGLRFILNMAECYLNPTIKDKILSLCKGEPRLYAAIALIKSAAESVSDVRKILEREKVPLYKGKEGFAAFGKVGKYSTGWTYPQYLKIMVGLLPKGMYFRRLQRALENNYDIELSSCYTAVERKQKLRFKGKIIPFVLEREIGGRLSYVEMGEGEP